MHHHHSKTHEQRFSFSSTDHLNGNKELQMRFWNEKAEGFDVDDSAELTTALPQV